MPSLWDEWRTDERELIPLSAWRKSLGERWGLYGAELVQYYGVVAALGLRQYRERTLALPLSSLYHSHSVTQTAQEVVMGIHGDVDSLKGDVTQNI